MINKKSIRGITLISLIVTIIVMLILAGVVLTLTINQDGVIKRTEDVKSNYALEEAKERIMIKNFLKYTEAYDRDLSDEIVEVMAELVAETGISEDKLVIYYDRKTNKDYILYRIKTLTQEELNEKLGSELKDSEYKEVYEELLELLPVKLSSKEYVEDNEKDILEDAGIRSFICDLNNDGVLTVEDSNIITKITSLGSSYNKNEVFLFADVYVDDDNNTDKFINIYDEGKILETISGAEPLYKEWNPGNTANDENEQ